MSRAPIRPVGASPSLERFGRLALVAVTVAAVASSIAMNEAPATAWENLAIAALASAFLALLLAADDRLEGAGARAKVAYFTVQLGLGAAVLLLQAQLSSFGTTWLLLMLLLVQGTPVCSWQGVAALTVAALLLPAVHASWLVGPGAAMEVILGLGAVVLFVLLFSAATLRERRARTESERLAAQLGKANRRLAELAVETEELAAARERNRLAREIHDSVGHSLTVASVQLQAAEVHLASDRQRAGAAIAKAASSVRYGLDELRRSVRALRAGPLDDGSLAEALDGLRAATEAEGLEVTLRLLGERRPVRPEIALALYRAAQEGLTNVRKHARAARAEILLDYRTEGQVALEVTDDGAGSRPENDGGFGLLGLSERVGLLGGTLKARPRPEGGFELRVEVPE